MYSMHFSKQAVQQKHWDAERQVQRERMRRRDDKRAGRAGPPDAGEVPAAAWAAAEEASQVSEQAEEAGSVGGWDMVDGEGDVRSPGSCHPPCISHTRARCSVS